MMLLVEIQVLCTRMDISSGEIRTRYDKIRGIADDSSDNNAQKVSRIACL